MSRIRAFEDEVVSAYNAGSRFPARHIRASARRRSKVGAVSALGPDDLILATYRGHGEAIARGVDPTAVMTELMAQATGLCKGKGGSMHLSDPEVGLLSTNAIVAGHIPIAGGVALSCKLAKPSRSRVLLRRRRVV